MSLLSQTTDNQKYESLIDNLTVDLVTRGVTDFDQLIVSLPGVYPSIALRAIERLIASNRISDQVFFEVLKEIRRGQATRSTIPSSHRIILPIQHPLDYDWRFADTAVERLLDECLKYSERGEMITFIGCPTLLRAAIEADNPRQLSLLDANRSVIDCLSKASPLAHIRHCNVSKDRIPELFAKVVAIDPPWYEEYFRLFIWAACHASVVGAYLLASMPPIGTRPGIDNERDDILKWTQETMGMELISLEPAALPYITPPFEYNALRSEGLHHTHAEWRRGDLAVFRRVGEFDPQRPELVVLESEWAEETVLGMRVRVRHQEQPAPGFQDPSISSILAGDILPSVSRRDERRRLAGVWTSGNRVFSCHGRNTLRLILKSLSAGRQPVEEIAVRIKRRLQASEESLISRVVDRIMEIAAIESKENLARGYQ
jgi:hypothetical protein